MPTSTIYEVAKVAGVSAASVSRILRGGAGYTYPPETEMRVREAAERLGYQANAAARLLRQQHLKTIGLGAEVSDRPHMNHLVLAVHDELKRVGYEPILFEPRQLVPSVSHAPFPSLEMLAGMLCIDFSLEEQFPEVWEMVYSQVPVVALYPTQFSSAALAFTDLSKGIEIAVKHLVSLGHRRIMYANVTGGFHPAVPLKMQGWLRACKNHSLVVPAEYVINMNHRDTIAEMGEKTAQHLLHLSPAPTAVVCGSDEVALRVINHLTQAGRQIPHDVSVVGFDGIEVGEYSNPPLTTVAQPIQKIAKAAVENIVAQINQRASQKREGEGDGHRVLDTPMKKLFAPTLQVRGSTAPPKN